MKSLILTALVVSLALCSEIGRQEALAVTIYNDDFAMVKDVRQISFQEGESVLYFTSVSANIQTQTVTFKALQNPQAIRVFEQNFQSNLVDEGAILQKYLEREIKLFVKLGHEIKSVEGVLLGYSSGYILKTNSASSFTTEQSVSGFLLARWPFHHSHTPLETKTKCEVAYRTTGFSWKADYSITLNQLEDKADLGGWVTIDNHSGKRYLNAKLKLIAGDVNTVQNNQPMEYLYQEEEIEEEGAAIEAPSFSEKSFADYHLYTLSDPVSLNEASQKQVEFLSKVYALSIRKYNEIRISVGGYSETNLPVTKKVNFMNSQANGLGVPFPKGIVRVFKEDGADGSLEFIGEDRIDHTPKDENISLVISNAFDIVAHKYQEAREDWDNRGSYRAEMNMTIKNHKDVPTEVVVIMSNYHGDELTIDWEENNVELVKRTSEEFHFQKVLEPNEIWVSEWVQLYRA